MDFIVVCVFNILFFFLNKSVCDIIEYNVQYFDFFFDVEQIEVFVFKKFFFVLVWVFMGDCFFGDCKLFGDEFCVFVNFGLFFLDGISFFIDFDVKLF